MKMSYDQSVSSTQRKIVLNSFAAVDHLCIDSQPQLCLKGYYFADVTQNAPAKEFISSKYLLCGKHLRFVRSGDVFI